MKKHPAAACAILAALSLACTAIGASAQPDASTRALQYLAGQQKPDGSIDVSIGETADYALGAAAAGYDPNTLRASSGKSVYDYFAADLAAATPKATQNTNSIGKELQALVAGGSSHAGAVGSLVSMIQADYNSSTGAYCVSGDSNCTSASDAVFDQSNAILGLVASGTALPGGNPNPVSYLKSLQVAGGAGQGGWGDFTAYDTNATAMAMMALVAAGDTPAGDAAPFNAAFSFLHSQQDPASGGFTYSSAYGTTSDPDSDALVIQALVAAGQAPGSAAWSNSKGSAVTDLPTFQDQASGGFSADHSATISNFSTTQAPAGLKQAPFPVLPRYSAGAALPASAAAASPSPSASAAASPSPSATAAAQPARLAQTGGERPPSPLPGPALAAAAALVGLGGASLRAMRGRHGGG